jgi:hypothetical protein
VRNDVHQAGSLPLLDPNLPPTALLRCDQLMFFTQGVQSIESFRNGAGSNHKGQGTASRVLYSPAFQVLRTAPAVVQAAQINAHDPNFPAMAATNGYLWNSQIPPWFPDPMFHTAGANSPNLAMNGTAFLNNAGPGDYAAAPNPNLPAVVNALQPFSREWLLVREALVMANDDAQPAGNSSKVVFLNDNRALYTMFPVPGAVTGPIANAVRKGRVDAIAEQFNDVRNTIVYLGNNASPWIGTGGSNGIQRDKIMRAMYYPRAERKAPSMSRVDQALTNNVISGSCSSFRVEWTYAGGTGQATNAAGTTYNGVFVDSQSEQPWFGLQDVARGVYNYGEINQSGTVPNCPFALGVFNQAATIYPDAIETNLNGQLPQPYIQDYWAVFGYNQNEPLNPGTGQPWVFNPPIVPVAYTPFPTALRITMTLQDPEGKLESGREFQFVVDLPRRVSFEQ